MKKAIFITLFILISIIAYSREVTANNYGIANASPGDYIIRSSGEKVILKQSDIDYARRQLGISTSQSTPNRTLSQNNSSSSRSASSSNSDAGTLIIIILVVVIIVVIIGKSVSNITTTVAKNSGMNYEDAKKIGTSAGVLAGTAAAIGAAALLGKAGGLKSDKKDITIHHKY